MNSTRIDARIPVFFAAVAEEGYRALVASVKDALARENKHDPASRVMTIGRAYVAFALMEPARYRVMTGPRSNESGRFPDLEIPITEAFNLLNQQNLSRVETRAFLVGTPATVGGPTPLVFQDAAMIATEGLSTPAFRTPLSSTSGIGTCLAPRKLIIDS